MNRPTEKQLLKNITYAAESIKSQFVLIEDSVNDVQDHLNEMVKDIEELRELLEQKEGTWIGNN